jgi:single-strand DNA-binding protein
MSIQMHVISGFVGGKPETREVTTANGTQTVATVSVAVNNPRKRDAEPLWYRVTMWNGLGDTVAQYVDKGDYVVVQGERLTISTWVDQQGNPRATLELTASSVDFRANRRGEGDAPDNTPEEEDIPF